MAHTWRVTVWGVRGAFPQLGSAAGDFGGNTSCVSVETGGGTVVLDAGSGLSELARTWKGGRLDILLTHLHLDHIMGIVSFPPVFDPKAELHFYGPAGFRQALDTLLSPPFWPVGFRDFRANIQFHELTPGGAFRLGDVQADTLEGSHPNGALYYRLRGEGRSLVYALDCELNGDFAPRLTDFVRGADLLIWDANFVESDPHPGWGHSTWEQGLALGRQAGVGRLLMTHYDRGYTGDFLSRQEALARERDGTCLFAREGMVLVL